MDGQLTLEQFGQKIKSKYPQYKDMPDADVGAAVIQKYPQYQSQVVMPQDNQNQQGGENPLASLGKLLLPAMTNLPNTVAQNNAKAAARPSTKGDLIGSIEGAAQDTGDFIKGIIKPGLELGSYMTPFGNGANIATKAIIPGVAAGAASAASQDNSSTGGDIAGGVVGGTAAAATHGISNILSKLLKPASAGLQDVGSKVVSSQYQGISKGVARENQLNDTVKQLSRYGITGIDDVINKAPQVTGSDGVINQMVKDAIGKAGTVDTGGIRRLSQNLLDDEPLLTDQQKKSFQKVILNGINSTSQDAGKASVKAGEKAANYGVGEVGGAKYQVMKGAQSATGDITKADPLKTFKFIQDLESKAHQFSKSQDETAKSLGRVYSGVAAELKDRLFAGFDSAGKQTGKGADSMLFEPTEKQLEALHSIHPELANDVMKSKNVSELRSLQAPFVRASKMANMVEQNAGAKPVNAFDVLSVVLGGPAGLAAAGVKKFAESNKGKQMIGNTIAGTGRAIGNSTANPNILELLSALAGSRSVQSKSPNQY